jgi:hypothetical protein
MGPLSNLVFDEFLRFAQLIQIVAIFTMMPFLPIAQPEESVGLNLDRLDF